VCQEDSVRQTSRQEEVFDEEPINLRRIECAAFYRGIRNPGTGCYCISFIAALSCLATERAWIDEFLRGNYPSRGENTVVAASNLGKDIARDHGVKFLDLQRANAEVFNSGSLFGKVLVIPESENSVVACIRRLCLLGPLEPQKRWDLKKIAATRVWPDPTVGEEHQCAEELITGILEAIPALRELTAFTQDRWYTCPLCQVTTTTSEVSRKFVVYTERVGSSVFNMRSFSEQFEPARSLEPWKCDNCGTKIRVDKRVRRTMPDILMAVVHRVNANLEMMMPREDGNLRLNSVICHVGGGTHYVTKMISLGALANDEHLFELPDDEGYAYRHDFIHFYVNGKEQYGSHVNKRSREEVITTLPFS